MKRRMGPTERVYPMPVPLIVGGSEDELDVMTVAWIGVASAEPPSLAMAIRHSRRTLELIRETGEFTVNFPPVSLAKEVDYCGTASGRKTDKFADTGLTPSPSSVVATPIIEECPYNMECKVTREIELGGPHVLLIGEVLETHADEGVLVPAGDMVDVGALDPLVYCAGTREYRGLSGKVADAYTIGRQVLGD